MALLDRVRRMPRMLQTLSALGMLLLLAAIVVLSVEVVSGITDMRALLSDAHVAPPGDWFWRPLSAGFALGLIGMACVWPTSMYVARRRHPGRAGPRLETWPTQIMAALALAALPLCSLALTPLISYTNSLGALAAVLAAALNVIEALLLVAANIWTLASISFG
ncbi:MAG: hypothetical protein KGO05_07640 [Chloroflexota bacterium]|nr:hypothetical protein [Chloroflexota bacterium]